MSQQSPAQHPRHLSRGFSLTELLIVVVIMGIMAAFILPKMRLDNTAVDTSARTISMAIMVAQRDAVARQHNVLVEFDTASHTARTVWDANNNRIADNGEKTVLFLLPESVTLGRPAGVSTLGSLPDLSTTGTSGRGGPQIILQRSGAADRAGVVYITSIRAKNGGEFKDSRAVFVARATGRPTWYVWTGAQWRRGV